MSVFEKERFEIWNPVQHPWKHPISEFSYTNPAFGSDVVNLEQAIDWIVAVLYPNMQASVATVADLPSSGNTINDMRVVQDDGDGKAASYRWEQREGDASAKWYKIYDMDWGEDSILSSFLLKTQDVYVYKQGYDDIDSDGNTITGLYAGKSVWGGASVNTNLTLFANSGDGTGADTGYIQFEDHIRPTSNNAIDLGESSTPYNFRTGYFGTSVVISTLTLAPASITDSTGTIDFGNENLITTGYLDIDGGFKDQNVTTAILLGDASNTAFETDIITSSSSIVGAINQIQDSQKEEINTGVLSWSDSGDYYTITGSDFTLERGGIGYIKGKKVTWSGSQTVTIPSNDLSYIYIDSNGSIDQISYSSVSDSTFADYIVLFEVLNDGTNVIAVKEDHPYNFSVNSSRYLHNNVGTVIRGAGALVTRVSTGTGTVAGDKEIKIVGADVLEDHGLDTTIPDSGGSGVTWNIYYTDGSGYWIRHAQQTQITDYYNSSGTATQLDTNKFTVYTLYVCKDNKNTSTPTYYAIMDSSQYSNIGQAETAIADNTIARATNELFDLELCQIGYAIIKRNNDSTWYIPNLIVEKAIFNSKLIAGGAIGNASLITINTIDFNGILSTTDTTVQVALDTIDDIGLQLNVDNLRLDGNTLSSTDTNGNIIIDPNGSGEIEMGATFYPASNSTFDIGDATHVINDLYIDNQINDGTNTIDISTLMTLSSVNSSPNDGDALFYNSTSGKWEASAPDSEIDHGTLSGLSDDDHSQYALLAGRSGGQSFIGGSDASDNLTFESTSDGTKGSIFFKDTLSPYTNASYSGGWSGTDIGDSSHYINDLYMAGEAKGFRAENFTSGSPPSASAQNEGRLYFETDTNKLYVDNGGAWVSITSRERFESDTSWDGATSSKNVTVSTTITDARKCLWQLLDNNNNYEVMYVTIIATAIDTVNITTNENLPAGSYRLIGIGI